MCQGCFQVGSAEVEVGEVFITENGVIGEGRVFEEKVVEERVDNNKDALGNVFGWEVDGAADVCEVGDAGKRAHDGEKSKRDS